jgi:uncharacterized protein
MNTPCPICRAPAAPRATNPFAPFCGARCRDRDLAAWLDGDYAIPSDDPIPDGDTSQEPTD